MKKTEDGLTEEIANIVYNFNGVSWEDAWSMSYSERIIVVETLRKIMKKQQEAINKQK